MILFYNFRCWRCIPIIDHFSHSFTPSHTPTHPSSVTPVAWFRICILFPCKLILCGYASTKGFFLPQSVSLPPSSFSLLLPYFTAPGYLQKEFKKIFCLGSINNKKKWFVSQASEDLWASEIQKMNYHAINISTTNDAILEVCNFPMNPHVRLLDG